MTVGTEVGVFVPTGVSVLVDVELGIGVDVVVPGQPVSGVQLACWQRHHFGEACVDAACGTFYISKLISKIKMI